MTDINHASDAGRTDYDGVENSRQRVTWLKYAPRSTNASQVASTAIEDAYRHMAAYVLCEAVERLHLGRPDWDESRRGRLSERGHGGVESLACSWPFEIQEDLQARFID